MSQTLDLILAVVTICVYLGIGAWYMISSRDRTLRSLQSQLDTLHEKNTIAELEATIAEQQSTIDGLKEELTSRLEQLVDAERKST